MSGPRFVMPAAIVRGTTYDADVDEWGMPLDRTVCPDCRNAVLHRGKPNETLARDGCTTCGHTGTVCPTCRGARYVATGTANNGVTQYSACSDCMMPRLHNGQHEYDDVLRRYRYERDWQGEVDAITRYRESRRSERVAEILAEAGGAA